MGELQVLNHMIDRYNQLVLPQSGSFREVIIQDLYASKITVYMVVSKIMKAFQACV